MEEAFFLFPYCPPLSGWRSDQLYLKGVVGGWIPGLENVSPPPFLLLLLLACLCRAFSSSIARSFVSCRAGQRRPWDRPTPSRFRAGPARCARALLPPGKRSHPHCPWTRE